MKAVRGAEISLDTLNMPKFANYEDSALWQILKRRDGTSACSPSTSS